MSASPATDLKKAAAYQVLRWKADPVAFVREALRVEPQEWQALVLVSLVKKDRIAIRSGHGVGKSSLMSWIILWWLSTRYPAKVACTAPTAHQLYDVMWSELARWYRQLPSQVKDNFEWKTERFEVKGAGNESFAVARTARVEQPEALQGFHSPNMLFLVDEASGVPDIIFEVGEGSLSTAGAKVVLAGNPTRTSGYFFDAFHKSRSMWTRFKVSCLDSPMVAPGFIKSMAEKYGEDSNVYAIRVKGDFPRSEDDVVIPLNLLEDATQRMIAPQDGYRPVWGVDVARYGDDRSALAKRHMNRLLEPVKSWSQLDTMQLAGTIIAEYMETPIELRPSSIMVDVIGIGSGVVDRLREERMPVRGINVAESASTKQKFARLRDELWWSAREWFLSRGVWIPDDSDLISELSSVKYSLLGSGKLKVEGKDEMKKRGMRSPDCFVAGTLIQTPNGPQPIESLREGDRVITPFGISSVIRVWESQTESLTTAAFSNGATLSGKGKHEIFTWGHGWKRLDTLVLTDGVEPYHPWRLALWRLVSLSFIGARNSSFKQLIGTISPATRTCLSGFFIAGCGVTITALFQRATSFITSMAIGATTTFQTSLSCPIATTPPSTCGNGWPRTAPWSETPNTLIARELPPPSGMDRKKGLLGTPRTAGSSGRPASRTKSIVASVARNIFHTTRTDRASAQSPVSKNGITNTTKTLNAPVLGVARRLWLIATGRRPVVPVRVATESVAPTSVYNLTLANHNAYYANGILVSNCADAFILTMSGRAEITPDRQEQRIREVRMKLKSKTTWMAG